MIDFKTPIEVWFNKPVEYSMLKVKVSWSPEPRKDSLYAIEMESKDFEYGLYLKKGHSE